MAMPVLIISMWCRYSLAEISGAPGLNIKDSISSSSYCPGSEGNGIAAGPKADINPTREACSVVANGYVPTSGRYSLWLRVIDQNAPEQRAWARTDDFYIDATKPLQQQNLTTTAYNNGSGATNNYNKTIYLSLCYYLTGPNGETYILYETPAPSSASHSCPASSNGPLPPTPVPQPVSCKVNNGNSLSVDLGTLDRVNIPTVPGTGEIRSVEFPVTCTNGSASMKMQLNYTPITVSGSQVVNSSINGLGVAVSYNDKILAPSDITTMQFPEGNTDVTLKFEAVRNPSVAVGDIKTGPFTASAVLVMTQQ